MNFIESVKSVINKTFVYKGRASRSEFWWFYLFVSIIAFLLVFVIIVSGIENEDTLGLISQVFYFIVFIPIVSLTARRLHDIGKSGWWQVLLYIPITNFLILYWVCKKGDQNENKFGENPLKIK